MRYPHENVTKLCGLDYKKNVMVLLITVKVRTFSYLLTQKALIKLKSDVLTLEVKGMHVRTGFCSLLLLISRFS